MRWNTKRLNSISIHALRGEGDSRATPFIAINFHFNPRPPWGGRPEYYVFACRAENFNPRPPWGGRPDYIKDSTTRVLFQSTPSVGRATLWRYSKLRESKTFQSTPSVGRATNEQMEMLLSAAISIHALRGEGDRHRAEDTDVGKAISIHALRGEGDQMFALSTYFFKNFNPRPPWGGRRSETEKAISVRVFQSTPSVGRATPERCDRYDYKAFQSTPSVGRATFSLLRFYSKYVISIHALRGEGDFCPSL